MSAGPIRHPEGSTISPVAISCPVTRTCSQGAAGPWISTLPSSRQCSSSDGTTTLHPGGIGSPVSTQKASPGTARRTGAVSLAA